VTLAYDDARGVYFDAARDARESSRYFTLFCGDGGEELDVAAHDVRHARAIGDAAIARDYVPMTIARVEPRYRGLTYF
jgi:hypothetical protein